MDYDIPVRLFHLIGYWCNTIFDEYIFPQELPLITDPDLRETLVDYLHNGWECGEWMGFSACRFACGIEPPKMGSKEFTDGTWAWPEGLPHYIEAHHVALPDEFIATVLGTEGDLPEPDPDDPLYFWRDWCAKQRTNENKALIADLQQKHNRDIERAFEHFYRLQTRSIGESEAVCMWQGCQQPALVEKALCARHLYEGTDSVELYDVSIRVKSRYNWKYLGILAAAKEDKKKDPLHEEVYKDLNNFLYATNYRIRSTGSKYDSEVILAAGAARSVVLRLDSDPSMKPKLIKKWRGVLILTDQKLICGDWAIELSEIREAAIVRIRKFFGRIHILKIKISEELGYQFNIPFDRAWEEQSVIDVDIHVTPKSKKPFHLMPLFEILSWLIIFGIFAYVIWLTYLQNPGPR